MTGKLLAMPTAMPLPATEPPPAGSSQPPSGIGAGICCRAREQEILRGIARGQSNKEIARALGIAETTVKIHVQHILRKLEVSSRRC
jgi:two-component system nitrate/nitrite response regulator NarL